MNAHSLRTAVSRDLKRLASVLPAREREAIESLGAAILGAPDSDLTFSAIRSFRKVVEIVALVTVSNGLRARDSSISQMDAWRRACVIVGGDVARADTLARRLRRWRQAAKARPVRTILTGMKER